LNRKRLLSPAEAGRERTVVLQRILAGFGTR